MGSRVSSYRIDPPCVLARDQLHDLIGFPDGAEILGDPAVEALLDAGADPNLRSNGVTPLWQAEDDFGMTEIAQLLRNHGGTEK